MNDKQLQESSLSLQQKDKNIDKNKFEILKTVLPIKEGMDNLVKELTKEMSPYFLKIVEMGMAKPINPIIFAPRIEQNLTINIDSNNPTTIDTSQRNCGNTTINDDHRISVDARRKNCDNIKLTKKEDNRIINDNRKNNSENVKIKGFLKLIEDNSTHLKLNYLNQNCGNDYRNTKMLKSASDKLRLKD